MKSLLAASLIVLLPALAWSQTEPDSPLRTAPVGEAYGGLFSAPEPPELPAISILAAVGAPAPRGYLVLLGYTASGVGNTLSSTLQAGYQTKSPKLPFRVRANYSHVAISHLPDQKRFSGTADLVRIFSRASSPIAVVGGVVDANHTRNGNSRFSGVALGEAYRGKWTGTVNLGWSVLDRSAGDTSSDATLGFGARFKATDLVKLGLDFSFANELDPRRGFTVSLESKLPVKHGAPKLIVKFNRDEVLTANLATQF